jgi:hypothetical protein
MTGPILTRARQIGVVVAAVGSCAVSAAAAVSYVAIQNHQVQENSRRLDRLEIVVPVVQTNLAVVQSQLASIQTTLDRIDERGARRDLTGK